MNPIEQVLEDLATCLCAQIITDGLPEPCFCGVMPGEAVAFDYAGSCADACGMAWVRLASAYPSTAIGIASGVPGNCSSTIGLDVELGIVRCIEVGSADGAPPTPEQLNEAAILQQADLLAIWRAVACCRQSKDWILGQYAPFGPEGGLVGGVMQLSLQVF
jgi:hypothetical protein